MNKNTHFIWEKVFIAPALFAAAVAYCTFMQPSKPEKKTSEKVQFIEVPAPKYVHAGCAWGYRVYGDGIIGPFNDAIKPGGKNCIIIYNLGFPGPYGRIQLYTGDDKNQRIKFERFNNNQLVEIVDDSITSENVQDILHGFKYKQQLLREAGLIK